MDIASAFGHLAEAIASAGPWAIVTAVLVGHLLLDVAVIKAGLRSKPLWVPGWIYEDVVRRLAETGASLAAATATNHDLTDIVTTALIRRDDRVAPSSDRAPRPTVRRRCSRSSRV